MRKSMWIILAVLVVGISAPNAFGNQITLHVSGTLTPGGGATCPVLGCTLGGTLVIDNTAGTVVSADVTINGESPLAGPFTQFDSIMVSGSDTEVVLDDSPAADFLALIFATPTAGSLVNYEGGGLSTLTQINVGKSGMSWQLTNGALTPATPTAEPSTAGLMLLGIGMLLVMRNRLAKGLQQAA
jgi:hypothetical protein